MVSPRQAVTTGSIWRAVALIGLLVMGLPAACRSAPQVPATPAPDTTPVASEPSPQALPRATGVAATRVGANYVLRLPRETDVPAGWVMNPLPDYQTRAPQTGDTYRFACLDLPARSTGIATVGYRHLEGLPSVAIEYVVYPSVEAADEALADMQRAVEDCPAFTIGQGDATTTASFAPLDFPAQGDGGFAAALNTSGPVTGDLLTHMVKVRRGHVVIGISHAGAAGADPPDAALTLSLVELAVARIGELLTGY